MARIDFLSWSGFRHFLSALWERIDAIFLRKTDPKVAHLSYDEDASTLIVDASVSADRAAFKEIVVGDASAQGEFAYDRIEATIVDSSNPIMAHAMYGLAVYLQEQLAAIDKKIDDIWDYLHDSNPSYRASDNELDVKLEGLSANIAAVRGVLGTITDPSQTSVDALPASNYYLDPDNENTMYIKPEVRNSGE